MDNYIDNKTKKIISISKRRQITIPLHFYNHLKLGSEVECSLDAGAIVIRPTHRGSTEFSVEILKDLIEQGYSGDQLVKQFEIKNGEIKNAIASMLEEADSIVAGKKPASNLEEIFNNNN